MCLYNIYVHIYELMRLSQMQQCSRPTIHVDSFLYDEDQVDFLCEDGTMSRSYCLTCGSHRTAPLGQNISSSSHTSLARFIIFILFFFLLRLHLSLILHIGTLLPVRERSSRPERSACGGRGLQTGNGAVRGERIAC